MAGQTRPTHQGWIVVACAVATVLLGRVFGVLELYVLAAALISAFVAGCLIVLLRRPRIAVRRWVRPAVLTAGDVGRVDLELDGALIRNVARLGDRPQRRRPLDKLSARFESERTREYQDRCRGAEPSGAHSDSMRDPSSNDGTCTFARRRLSGCQSTLTVLPSW